MLDKNKKLKVLIAGDDWVTTKDLIDSAKRIFEGYDYTIDSYDVVMDKPMSRDRKDDIGDDSVTEYCGRPEELIERIKGVNVLIAHTAPITKQVVEAGKDLIAIGCSRSDPVSANVKMATEKGVYFFNAPGRSVEPVSDLVITFALTLCRNIVRANRYVKEGRWIRDIGKPTPDWAEFVTFRGPVLKGKKFGVVGLGKIGKRVAEKAAGLGMDVQVYDPFLDKNKLKEYGTICTLEELFKVSDFVTIHVPPVPSNKNLINKKLFDLMKPTAYFINASRGEIIDENALIDVLTEKKIAGAALDVYWVEPLPADHPLTKLDNVILTPHIAGQRNDVSKGSAEILESTMKPFFQEGSLDTCMNAKSIKRK